MKNGRSQPEMTGRASGAGGGEQRPSGNCPVLGKARVLDALFRDPLASQPGVPWEGGLGSRESLRGKLPSQDTAVQTHRSQHSFIQLTPMSSNSSYLIFTQLRFIGKELMLRAGNWSIQGHTASDPMPCLDALPDELLGP